MARFSQDNQPRKKPLAAAEQQARALALRKQGWTYQEIADELGYANPSGPFKAITKALKALIQEPTDALRRMELERLDLILKSLMPALLKGSPRHAEVALKAMDRRAALLGLDAPKVTEDHRHVTVRVMAEQIARDLGLSVDEVIAEANTILAQTAGDR